MMMLWLILLSVIGQLETVSSKKSKSIDDLLDICYDGIPDVVFTAGQSETFLFKGDHYWQVFQDNETGHMYSVNPSRSIRQTWEGLPSHLDLSYTISGTNSNWSQAKGRTFFVKGRNWYQYFLKGKTFSSGGKFVLERKGNTDLWFTESSLSSMAKAIKNNVKLSIKFDKVIVLRDESILIFKSHSPTRVDESALLLDDPVRPESIEVFLTQSFFHPTIIALQQSSLAYYLIPAPTPQGMYLVFQDQRQGYICFMPSMSSACSRIQSIASLFQCPSELEAVRNKYTISRMTHLINVSPHDAILLIIGFQVAISCTLLSLIKALRSE
jgi:hypothetical protein